MLTCRHVTQRKRDYLQFFKCNKWLLDSCTWYVSLSSNSLEIQINILRPVYSMLDLKIHQINKQSVYTFNPLNSVFNFKYSVKIWSCSNLASIGDKMSWDTSPKTGLFYVLLTLWLLSALLAALPNKVYILSQKRFRKAPYFVKWHFMLLIWSCLSFDSISIAFSPFWTNFLAIFFAVLMITFKNGVRHEWRWSNYIRSTVF